MSREGRTSTAAPVAAIANRDGQDAQRLLAQVVAGWRAAGLRVIGLLAEGADTEGPCSAAFLRSIGDGQRFSIQLDAPPVGTLCHLDTRGLDAACADLLPRLGSADVVVLSKFGKTEAAEAGATGNGGLRAVFAGAMAAGIPLLTTVSAKHAAAWAAFAPGATWVEADAGAIREWLQAAGT